MVSFGTRSLMAHAYLWSETGIWRSAIDSGTLQRFSSNMPMQVIFDFKHRAFANGKSSPAQCICTHCTSCHCSPTRGRTSCAFIAPIFRPGERKCGVRGSYVAAIWQKDVNRLCRVAVAAHGNDADSSAWFSRIFIHVLPELQRRPVWKTIASTCNSF